MDDCISPTTGRRVAWVNDRGDVETADDLTLAEAHDIQAHYATSDWEWTSSPGVMVALSKMQPYSAHDYEGG